MSVVLKEPSTTRRLFQAMLMIVLCFILPCYLLAQTHKERDVDVGHPSKNTEVGFFKIKIPQGFHQESVDEPGIYKWKKDSGEICVVVGDPLLKSADAIFKSLHKSAQKNVQLDEAKIVKIKGAKALLCKEKASSSPNRLRTWRLIVLTEKKMMNVDFTAPNKDFESYRPAFEEALRSFRLVSQS